MPAIDVFTASIKYMRDHLVQKVNQQLVDVHDDDICWVLTVPAIWNEAAKQFMREAAKMVGLKYVIVPLETTFAIHVYTQYNFKKIILNRCKDDLLGLYIMSFPDQSSRTLQTQLWPLLRKN